MGFLTHSRLSWPCLRPFRYPHFKHLTCKNKEKRENLRGLLTVDLNFSAFQVRYYKILFFSRVPTHAEITDLEARLGLGASQAQD